MYNNEYFQNMSMENNIDGNNNYVNNDMDVDVNVSNGPSMNQPMPIHVCPIHTRIINHHIYKHTYRPCYTCSEENVCSSIQCGSCCQFR